MQINQRGKVMNKLTIIVNKLIVNKLIVNKLMVNKLIVKRLNLDV